MYKSGGGQLLTNRRAFTLIELLAVIVILAIIALIAVPIVLNIIEDAKNESNERSVELYASAVKNGIAKHQLTGEEVPAGTYSVDEEDKTLLRNGELTFKVDYEGNVECTTVEIKENGNVILEGCKVNGGEETYNYGKTDSETSGENGGSSSSTQVYKPQYYSWSEGFIEETLPSDATENASELGKKVYLGLDVDSNNKVVAAYACFTRNETEYCLKGDDTDAYATNQAILEDAFKDALDNCRFSDEDSYFSADDVYVYAASYGDVNARDGLACYIENGGYFYCL